MDYNVTQKLKEAWELHQVGAISEDEFKQIKEGLLTSSHDKDENADITPVISPQRSRSLIEDLMSDLENAKWEENEDGILMPEF